LTSQARFIGTINNISSPANRSYSDSQAAIQNRNRSTSKAKRRNNESYFCALFYLLTFRFLECGHPWYYRGNINDVAVTDIRFLYEPQILSQIKDLYPNLYTWIQQNRHMDIEGLSLESRLKGGPDLGKRKLKNCLKYFRTEDDTPCPQVYERIDRVLKFGMRLAVLDFGLGWVSPSSRVGDQICLLQGCVVPVVLRARATGGWNLVGEAILYEGSSARLCHMRGLSWTARKEAQTLDIY
jgi:hypothetical protein